MEYQLIEKIRLLFSLIYTKIHFRNARLVRYPSVITGVRYIRLGARFTTGYYCRINAISSLTTTPKLVIGDDVEINDSVHIACISSVHIGNNCLIASRVFITDHQHGNFPVEREFDLPVAKRRLSAAPVNINNNVWIGEGVVVLPGVNIGSNAIIGANSVVTKDVPPNSIACGVPSRVIKIFDRESSIWKPV